MLSPAKNSSPLLLVGLGNPGSEYTRTRHNVGFTALQTLFPEVARKEETAFRARIARATINNHACILLEPLTFMNASGEAVRAAADYFHIPTHAIVVVHDEADLPFGTLAWKESGGHAGHNGIRSIMEHLGTGDFARIRFGIGRPPHPEMPLDRFVLAPFTPDEEQQLPALIEKVRTLIAEHLA